MKTILFCGDLALTRRVESTFRTQGVSAILASDLVETLKAADLLVVNVECPLTDSNKPAWTHFPCLKASTATAKLMQEIGVGFGSLANNHIADYGITGLEDTRRTLSALGIPHSGAGSNDEEASRAGVIDIGEARIGILCLAQPEISAAGPKKWGAAVLREGKAISAISKLAGEVDIAVAYLHFGVEFFKYPTPQQIRLSRALVDAGAKLVLGHHTHTPQGWEWYKEAFIAYNLGNFIFDMGPEPNGKARIGLLVQAIIDGQHLKTVSIIPIETANGSSRLLDTGEVASVVGELEPLCSAIRNEHDLRQKYYFVCRGNLEIHLRAFASYIRRLRNWRRAADVISMQFWPQLRQLRTDLIRFLLSGQAWRFEVSRKRQAASLGSRAWRAVCYFAALIRGKSRIAA